MASARETDESKVRFQIELEFVQCLANPNYLNYLAQRGFFKENSFINYLKYLLYWKDPDYAKYLKYPQCLHFLELLQYEHFRRELMNAQCAKFIDDQQLLHWQHYQRKRMKLLQEQADKTTGMQATSSQPQSLPTKPDQQAQAQTPQAGPANSQTSVPQQSLK